MLTIMVQVGKLVLLDIFTSEEVQKGLLESRISEQ